MDYHVFHDYYYYPENMVTIPAEIGRRLGIKPGYRLDWQPVEGKDEILVRVIPDRGELAWCGLAPDGSSRRNAMR